MPTVTIVKPIVTEEENERRKEILYDIITRIAYKEAIEEDKKNQ